MLLEWVVDNQDLNRASPKDNFSLPQINNLVYNTTQNAIFSIIDKYWGYNQVKIIEKDKAKIAFIMYWGKYAY
jgi:hypothetical protein